MEKLRVAVIGAGMIANQAHFPALKPLRDAGLAEVVGVADIRPEAAERTRGNLALNGISGRIFGSTTNFLGSACKQSNT